MEDLSLEVKNFITLYFFRKIDYEKGLNLLGGAIGAANRVACLEWLWWISDQMQKHWPMKKALSLAETIPAKEARDRKVC